MKSEDILETPGALSEDEFIAQVTEFLARIRKPGQPAAGADDRLIEQVGLDSLQLVALFGFIENLSADEIDEDADLENLTPRKAYRELYLS